MKQKQYPKFITRKDIAQIISDSGVEVTVSQVRDNEELWGLRACRKLPQVNARVVLYDYQKVRDCLIRRGLMVPPPQTGTAVPVGL